MAEACRVVGAGAAAGWRAALTPSCFPPVLFPFRGHLEPTFNAASLVVLFPPKDKPSGSWGRLWTAVGTDLAFIMTSTATALSRSSLSLRLKWAWSSAKEGKQSSSCRYASPSPRPSSSLPFLARSSFQNSDLPWWSGPSFCRSPCQVIPRFLRPTAIFWEFPVARSGARYDARPGVPVNLEQPLL